MQAAFASMISFTVGGIIPLLGGVFIRDPRIRLAVVAVSMLQLFSMLGLVRVALLLAEAGRSVRDLCES